MNQSPKKALDLVRVFMEQGLAFRVVRRRTLGVDHLTVETVVSYGSPYLWLASWRRNGTYPKRWLIDFCSYGGEELRLSEGISQLLENVAASRMHKET